MLQDAKSFSSFSVDKLETAKTFYVEKLGLKVSTIPEMQGMFNLEAGQNKVMVYEKSNHTPATFTVLNFMVKDIDQIVAKLTELGVGFEQYNIPEFEIKTDAAGIARGENGPAMAWFKDPAGNIMAVMEEK